MKGEYLGVEVTEQEVDILENAQEIMAKHHIYSVHMQMLIGRLRCSLGKAKKIVGDDP